MSRLLKLQANRGAQATAAQAGRDGQGRISAGHHVRPHWRHMCVYVLSNANDGRPSTVDVCRRQAAGVWTLALLLHGRR